MSKLSVIIPIYNSEKYLERCLKSVINQTLRNIEIICVNDGSSDNSLKIALDYAKKDYRITVIDKHNEGLVAAILAGLNAVTTEYVTFLNSTDYIDLNLYRNIIIKNIDLNIINNKTNFTYNNLTHIQENEFLNTHVAIWNEIYKTKIIKKYFFNIIKI